MKTTLEAYLDEQGISMSAFAARFGYSPHTIYKALGREDGELLGRIWLEISLATGISTDTLITEAVLAREARNGAQVSAVEADGRGG